MMNCDGDIYEKLNQWYHNQLGALVFESEKFELEKILPDYFGYHLLQLGGTDDSSWLDSSPIRQRIFLRTQYHSDNSGNTIIGELAALPIMSESIDVVLLPHVLEFTARPEQFLTQAVDTLIPEGRIIVIGFNPMSLWGMWWLVKHRRRQLPWAGHFHRIGLIRHWLNELDCEVETLKTFFFRPPVIDSGQRKKMRMVEVLGRSCWPWLGGLYIIAARKKVAALTSIRLPNRRPRVIAKNDATAPTTRSMNYGKDC